MVYIITLSDLKKHYTGKNYSEVQKDLEEYARMKRMHINHINESTGFAPVKVDYDNLYIRTDEKNLIIEIFIDESY
jgi:hypothetical protein